MSSISVGVDWDDGNSMDIEAHLLGLALLEAVRGRGGQDEIALVRVVDVANHFLLLPHLLPTKC
jgi:hypothetical protein